MAAQTNQLPVAGRLGLKIAATATLIGFVYGYDQGSIATALLFLTPDLHLSTFQATVVVTAVSVGTLVGALAGGNIANAIGRKRAMMAIAIGYALFSGLQALAFNAESLALVRFLLGLVVGVSIVAAPAFIAESTPKRIRGRMLVAFQIATISGIVVSYFIGLALAASENWRLILGLAAVPAIIAGLMLRSLPDTSRWYLMKGRRAEALDVLRRVDPEEDAEAQVSAIEDDLESTHKGSYTQLFRPPLRRAGIFVVGLGLLVQLTGINAIVYYSPTILKQVGFPSATDAILAAALLQAAGLVACIIAALIVDRWGRRPVLLSGVATMAFANAVLILAFAGGTRPALAFIGILLFLIGFSFGYGALVWVYVAESMPAQMRAIGGSALLTADLFANVVVGLFFLNAFQALGGALTFGIFFALAIISIAFIALLAPETKGRPLENIRAFWENGGRWPTHAPERGPLHADGTPEGQGM